VITWKCSVCWQKVQTSVKPPLIERLCRACAVKHWRKVVDIYKSGDPERLAQAQAKLAAAEEAIELLEEIK
jgi:hypothetical protein